MSGGSNTQLAADQTHGSAGDKLKDAVEMTSLEASRADDDAGPRTPAKDAPGTADEPPSLSAVARGKQKEAAAADGAEPAKDSLQIDRTDDEPVGPGSGPPADGPVCKITLLLPTGARHPYRIDAKYLEKRNVEIHDLTEDGKKDPFSISVYKLKELILREWRDEWENRPASPSSIRLIHFGKLLDDKEQLKSKPPSVFVSSPARPPCWS